MPRKSRGGRGGRYNTSSPTVPVTGSNSGRRAASLSTGANGSSKAQQFSSPKQSGRTTKNSSGNSRLGNRGRKFTGRRTPVPRPGNVRGRTKKSGQDPAFYKSEDGTIYRPGDFAYVDSQQPDLPYHICIIKDFKLARKDAVIADVKWFYRVTELPEAVYLLLMEDRKNGENADIFKHPKVRDRELFMAFNKDTHPASLFRGKCFIKNLAELGNKFAEFLDQDDSFFYSYGYKPESRRLTLENEESYVPGSQQAVLPECVSLDQRSPNYGSTATQSGLRDKTQVRAPRETMVWSPQESDEDLLMYLRAARSVALHAGVCMTGMLADGYLAASSDETSQHAFDVLYRNACNSEDALQELIKHPAVGRIIGKKNWKKEDALLFSKGMKQFGKNFNKIKAQLLPRKEITELVDYYYIWKKTDPGIHSRNTRRQRKTAHIRLLRQFQKPRQPSPEKEFIDWSSCDEDEGDSGEDREKTKGNSFYACHHCFAVEGSSWHHAGPDKAILCDECRIYYKNYGLMRSLTVKREPPEFLFKDYRESPPTNEGSSSPPADLSRPKKRKTRNSNGTRSSARPGLRSAKSYSVKNESDDDEEAEASESSEGSEYDAPMAVSKPKPLQARRSILEHLDECHRDDLDGPPPPKRQKREQNEGSLSEEDGSLDCNTGSAQKSPTSEGSPGDTSTTSGNDEEGDSPCSMGHPPESNQLPQHIKRVCSDSESSCARTDLVYIKEKKPIAETPTLSAPASSTQGPPDLPTPTANVKVPIITPHAPQLPMGPPTFLNFPQGHPGAIAPGAVPPQNPLAEAKQTASTREQTEYQQHMQIQQAVQMAMMQQPQGTPASHLHHSHPRYSLATSVYPVETPSSHHHEQPQQQHSQPRVFTFPSQEELLRQRMTGQIPGTPEQHQLATMVQQGYPVLAGQLDPATARLQEEQQQQHGMVTPQVLIPNVNISMEQYLMLQQQQASLAAGVSPHENPILVDFQHHYETTMQRVQKEPNLLHFPQIQHLLFHGHQFMQQLQSLAGQDQHTINMFIQQGIARIQQDQMMIQSQAQAEAAQKKLVLGRPPENGPPRNSRPSVIAGK